MPDGGASLFAAIGSALGTSGAAAGGTAAAGSLATTASAGVASGVTAGATGAAAAGAAAAGAGAGLSLAEKASLAATVAGTGAQLLSEKPKIEKPQASTRDAAQEEADRLSSLYRKRGRGAALLTPGGAAGDVSSPNLGSAALLGA